MCARKAETVRAVVYKLTTRCHSCHTADFPLVMRHMYPHKIHKYDEYITHNINQKMLLVRGKLYYIIIILF